jgi:hypothetical protein
MSALLKAVLSTLLPGNGLWPAASATHVPVRVVQRLTVAPPLSAAIDWLEGELPRDFPERNLDARLADLRRCEAANPAHFSVLLTEAVSAYYTDAAVQQVIEQTTGFPARPPQPAGRTVEPYDWAAFERQRARRKQPRVTTEGSVQ